jgi:CheY-like chemotaxis protein
MVRMKLRSVLVVDDNDADLLYVRIVLEAAGIADRVLCFGTAQEALAHLAGAEGADADLVLLDLNMPEMDGFGFLRAYGPMLDAGPAHAGVVVLTSSPDPADRRRAMAHGCVRGYLVKPIDTAAALGLARLLQVDGPRP